MKVNTLIVGFGIAGLSYAEQLRRHQKKFVVIAPEEESASLLAAGIVNPTVLKRFKPVWKAQEFLQYAEAFYTNLQNKIPAKFFFSLPIFRIFNDVREQNEWIHAATLPILKNFLNPNLQIENTPTGIHAPFGMGEVYHTAKIDNKALVSHYRNKLIPGQFISQNIKHQTLEIFPDFVKYENIKADNLVFCEGYQGVKNPFFNYLPLVGSKGQILTIQCDQLQQEVIFKGPIFLSPMGEHKFWVGATFERNDKSTTVSKKGSTWLLDKLHQFLKLPFQVIEHKAQIRATVIDRRPLLGKHPQHHRLYILNGVGTRGVLQSPLLSHWLYQHIENHQNLLPEVDIKRFENKYFRY